MQLRRAVVSLLIVGCGTAGTAPSVDATSSADTGDASGGPTSACPPDQLATDVQATGVTCAGFEDATRTTIDARCSVYLGWRDSCDGCQDPPTKWGSAGPLSCANGAGNNTCTTPDLGGPVQTFGLDLDNNVDGNDKVYGSLHCITAPRAPAPAPCQPGWFVTGKRGSSWMCSPVSEGVVGYVRDNCSVYLGWQDACDGCVTPPVKWGFAGDGGCQVGAGADDTCSVATLGGEMINLFGLNFDGDVDGNDKLHIALHCKSPAPSGAPTPTTCPAGEFATGTNADGSLACASPAPVVAKYFADHCSLYFGWSDNCDGCTNPPTKWGTVRTGACANGAGVDDTCTDLTLGGEALSMLGLSPDGNVDGNDKLYVGFRCQ